MFSFVQYIQEREDLPDYPKHPGISPLDWEDVGKTEIEEDELEEAGTFAQQTYFTPAKEFATPDDPTKLKPLVRPRK